MLESTNSSATEAALTFLQQVPQQRLLTLENLGLARYTFLVQMPLTEENIICVARFLGNPQEVKFPQLQGADLRGLILDGVNLIRGNLSQAKLQGSSLQQGDLIFANFRGANLENADLRGATLNETKWRDAVVKNCRFGKGIGLTPSQREELAAAGAIFE